MISKEQYQQLKQLCRSFNANDVIMVGPVILGLRNSKQLSNKAVRNLFAEVDKLSWLQFQTSGKDRRTFSFPNTTFGTFSKLDLKWKWLNGTL